MSTYHYLTSDEQVKLAGDYSRLKNLLSSGHISNETLVSEDGGEWKKLHLVIAKNKRLEIRANKQQEKEEVEASPVKNRAAITALMLDILSYVVPFLSALAVMIAWKDLKRESSFEFMMCVIILFNIFSFVLLRAKADQLLLMIEIKNKQGRN